MQVMQQMMQQMLTQFNANMIKNNENFIKKLDARYPKKLPEKFQGFIELQMEFFTLLFTLLPTE